MKDSLYIAWRYIVYNKVKTSILVSCISLIAFLPISLQVLLNESENQLRTRALDTPLLVGARGSALDLVMNSLYFDEQTPELVSMQTANNIDNTGLAMSIPLYVRFQARGFSIVGTTLDYFDYRQLKIANGRQLALLGECVIGSEVARQLNLVPGDSLLSSPDNLFDIAGVYPLKMKVVGVLQSSQNADDQAVFVDIKTAWVIQGLGHGHEDLIKSMDSSVILQRDERSVTANAKLIQYTQITPENIDGFHFHGEAETYPLSAVIAVASDLKSATILRGRYVDDKQEQIAEPDAVVDGLLENIFRIKSVIDGIVLIVGLSTLLAIILVFVLSLRLRQYELTTIFKLGCSRLTVVRLLFSEVLIIVFISGVICTALLWVAQRHRVSLVEALLF